MFSGLLIILVPLIVGYLIPLRQPVGDSALFCCQYYRYFTV